MITLNKLKALPLFSRLVSRYDAAEEKIGVRYYDLGFVVYHALKNFHRLAPDIAILQYVIMPDHLHILLQIMKPLDAPLGDFIAIFKRHILLEAEKASIHLHGSKSIFEPGFNDQFLRSNRNLNIIYEYIRENPKRLWKIKQDPQFFSRIANKIIGDRRCSLFGNLHLLSNPFISEVVIHRKDTPEELARKKEHWRYILANGGVLVGAFISDAEKGIFKGAADYGGKLILVSNRGFEKREKPSGELFKLCSKGQLLIIAPELTIPPLEKGITRAECLQLNAFAESLAGSLAPRRPAGAG